MTEFRIPIQIVFYKEEGFWFAHCLNIDVIGDGQTKEEALDSLSESMPMQIQAAIEFNNPAIQIEPAPPEFWEMFRKGKDVATGELIAHLHGFPENTPAMREYTNDDVELALN